MELEKEGHNNSCDGRECEAEKEKKKVGENEYCEIL